MFPVSDSSQSVIDCLMEAAKKNNITILTNSRVEAFEFSAAVYPWKIKVLGDRTIQAKKMILGTGSDPAIWHLLEKLGLKIIMPVPSLFTFNIKDSGMNDLMGLSVENAECKILGTDLVANGPLLITHWGLSGPAILKLSAWGARYLADKKYQFKIQVNWLANKSLAEIQNHLQSLISTNAKKNVMANNEFGIPIRLWKKLCEAAEITAFQKWAETGKKHITKLMEQLTKGVFEVNGKSTFKDEFVTAGGVDLSEIDFNTFSSKKYPSLFMAGEVLNIDAITGGFNFQAAWTGAWHIAQAI
jgi:predicted Rossmann fold flavoprotein